MEPYCAVGVVSPEVRADVKGRCLLLFIVCDPSGSAQDASPDIESDDSLMEFSGEKHMKLSVMAPNEKHSEASRQATVCACPVLKRLHCCAFKKSLVVFPAAAV